MNFENLGVKITENRALDQKIWALKDFMGKMVFSKCSRAILEFLGWLEVLSAKYRGSCKISSFLGDFHEFLEWFRTYF
jgi:hypothetical protein